MWLASHNSIFISLVHGMTQAGVAGNDPQSPALKADALPFGPQAGHDRSSKSMTVNVCRF